MTKEAIFLTDNSVPHSESSSDSISSSVIERARRGDQVAFQRIVNLYGGLVYHWCRKSGLSREDAEDTGQQVFLSASRGLNAFRRERPDDTFRGWLRVITRSRIADHYRENAIRERAAGGENDLIEAVAIMPNDEQSDDDRDHDTSMLYEQAVKLVQSEFAEPDCQAFHLLVVDGLTATEVAEKLHMSVNSVYIAKSRILKLLRVEFAELLEDEVE